MVNTARLAEFFTLGRKRGWDTAKREWTVVQLMDAKGLIPTLGEVGIAFEDDARLKWSGDGFGEIGLREAVISSQGYELGVRDILVTLGAQNANTLAFAALIEPGESILFELPTWMHAIGAAMMLGAQPAFIRRREELQWRLDLDELRVKLKAQPKVFYFCNPNNPTGALFTSEEIAELCRLADEFGVWLVCDEVYRGLEWDGRQRPRAVCDAYHRGMSISSVSKTVGLDALRLGWIGSTDRGVLGRSAKMKQLTSTPHVSFFDEAVARAALEPNRFNQLVSRSLEKALPNRVALAKWAKDRKEIEMQEPEAGFLSFPSYHADVDSWRLCKTLLEEPYRTYVIPGICYDFEKHIRIAFGPNTSAERFRMGLELLGSGLVEIPSADGCSRSA